MRVFFTGTCCCRGDVRDMLTGLLSRVELCNCVLPSSATPRYDGQDKLDSLIHSSSPSGIRSLSKKKKKSRRRVFERGSMKYLTWQERSGYQPGEAKSQIHRANTRRENCMAMAVTEDRETAFLSRCCRTLQPGNVHLLSFSCEATDAPLRKLEL